MTPNYRRGSRMARRAHAAVHVAVCLCGSALGCSVGSHPGMDARPRPRVVLVLGAASEAKHHLCERLADQAGGTVVGAQRAIAAEIARGTVDGERCRELIRQREPVPTEVQMKLLLRAIEAATEPLIIPDFPATELDDLEASVGRITCALVAADGPSDRGAEAVGRALEGRARTRVLRTYEGDGAVSGAYAALASASDAAEQGPTTTSAAVERASATAAMAAAAVGLQLGNPCAALFAAGVATAASNAAQAKCITRAASPPAQSKPTAAAQPSQPITKGASRRAPQAARAPAGAAKLPTAQQRAATVRPAPARRSEPTRAGPSGAAEGLAAELANFECDDHVASEVLRAKPGPPSERDAVTASRRADQPGPSKGARDVAKRRGSAAKRAAAAAAASAGIAAAAERGKARLAASTVAAAVKTEEVQGNPSTFGPSEACLGRRRAGRNVLIGKIKDLYGPGGPLSPTDPAERARARAIAARGAAVGVFRLRAPTQDPSTPRDLLKLDGGGSDASASPPTGSRPAVAYGREDDAVLAPWQ